MGPFLQGFTDELIKRAVDVQGSKNPEAYSGMNWNNPGKMLPSQIPLAGQTPAGPTARTTPTTMKSYVRQNSEIQVA